MTGGPLGVRHACHLPPVEAKANDFVRFMRHVRVSPVHTDCWVWVGNRPDGRYGHFSLGDKAVKAHRWIYELVCGGIPPGLLLRHRCDNPACVNPIHLEPGTSSDNSRDMTVRGRRPNRQGEKHPLAKLTAERVLAIRKRSSLGVTHSLLAAEYGVGIKQIGKVVRRENWRHI